MITMIAVQPTGSIIWEVEGRWSGSRGYTDSPTQVEDYWVGESV